MIIRIDIKDVASFDIDGVSFDNMQKVNFIYGGNGTGKTTRSLRKGTLAYLRTAQ